MANLANIDDKKISEILLKKKYVSLDDIKGAEKVSGEKEGSISDYLVDQKLISKNILGEAIAQYFGVPYVDLKRETIDEDVFELIPELVSQSKKVAAFARSEDGVKVAMANPDDLEIRHLIEKRVGQKVLPHYVMDNDLREILLERKAGLKEEFKKLLKKLQNKSLSREARDEITVKMVDTLLQYGYQNKASDIHIEPYIKKMMVRFRIDGVMHDVLDIPNDLSEFIVARIKILSKMRTDVHMAAQDGKFRYNAGVNTVDVRVSVVPVTEGENVVMRLLFTQSQKLSLGALGLIGSDRKKVSKAIKSPHGMVLVTGPTGSGKTTTLYAILNILNKREINIATIEDPVEYDIEGVSQIQVNPKAKLTFANGLRSILRQDPDIIMVGEIRDEETAGIAVNSALTGHLVLSTLHTNNAATTLPRLIDMDIEVFLVASTINVAVAQRLVRKICSKCRTSQPITEEQKKIILSDPDLEKVCRKEGNKVLGKIHLYKGAGCKDCGYTGYTGRIGIFEVLEMNESIKKLIIERASSDEIMKAARSGGMTTMLEDGMKKVFAGVTTFEEVMRVSAE